MKPTPVEYQQTNKNEKKLEHESSNDNKNKKKPLSTFKIVIIVIISILYIVAIYLNVRFISKCDSSNKTIHYIMSIFSAPQYLATTVIWPMVCKVAETTQEVATNLVENMEELELEMEE